MSSVGERLANATVTGAPTRPSMLAVSLVYALLFVVGVCGNVWVVCVVVDIFRTLRSFVANRHVLVYILSLSIVDGLVLLCIPLIVADMLLNRWIFGQLLCKLYYAFESTNKILSTFILTAVSWDRYMAICYPFAQVSRSWRVSVVTVMASAGGAVVLLAPLLIQASAHPLTALNDTTVKCHSDLSDAQVRVFTSYMFACGFVLPALLITCFYARILARLRDHSRTMSAGHSTASQVPVRKVALSALLVVGFYYAVWTPYWACMLWFMLWPPDLGQAGVSVMYFVHALPYANSALNWVFYALLNRQLRLSHSAAAEMRRQSGLSRRHSQHADLTAACRRSESALLASDVHLLTSASRARGSDRLGSDPGQYEMQQLVHTSLDLVVSFR